MCIVSDSDIIKKLWSGQWETFEKDLCKDILNSDLENEELDNKIKSHCHNDVSETKILQTAVNLFLLFCEKNWSPHPKEIVLEELLGVEWPKSIDVLNKLQRDSEPLYTNILYPELLYFSSLLFNALYSANQNLVSY